MKVSLWSLFRKPIYLITGLSMLVVLFDIQFYMLKVLPGNLNQSCYPGAYFTPFNLLFAFIISALIALNIIGFAYLIRLKITKQITATGSLSAIGLLFATLTSFCTLCVLPVVSLFGVGVSLSFFTDYLYLFKLLSFTILMLSTYLLNQQIKKNCSWCIN